MTFLWFPGREEKGEGARGPASLAPCRMKKAALEVEGSLSVSRVRSQNPSAWGPQYDN